MHNLTAFERFLVKWLRWPAAILYAFLCVSVVALSPGFLICAAAPGLILLFALFGFCDSTTRGPVEGGRAWAAAAIAAVVFTFPLLGLSLAALEVLQLLGVPSPFTHSCWLPPALGFPLSAVAFRALLRRARTPFAALRRMTHVLLLASVLEIGFSGVALLIVRHYAIGAKFEGLGPMLGAAAGAVTLLWSLGLGISLLFQVEHVPPEPGFCPACNYSLRGLPQPRCPECGRPFTTEEADDSSSSVARSGDRASL